MKTNPPVKTLEAMLEQAERRGGEFVQLLSSSRQYRMSVHRMPVGTCIIVFRENKEVAQYSTVHGLEYEDADWGFGDLLESIIDRRMRDGHGL